MSMAVAQRLPELGVRLALGARPADVFRLVFTDGLRLAALGLAAGAGAAVLLAPALDAVLFEVAPRDPGTLAATAALLLVVAAAATFLPARRATAVDPVQTLRE
jgi:ABC-type lipoprotein release transport system permease subunit